MKKTLITACAVVALLAGSVAPAQAAGFAAKESWTHGATGIEKWADSATCEFMKSHSNLMRLKEGQSYQVNEQALMKDKFVRDYMSRHIDKGAGEHANMVPADVRKMLIDLGILAVLKRAAQCEIIPNANAVATAEFDKVKREGDEKFASVDPIGVIAELPTLFSSSSS